MLTLISQSPCVVATEQRGTGTEIEVTFDFFPAGILAKPHWRYRLQDKLVVRLSRPRMRTLQAQDAIGSEVKWLATGIE